VKPPDRLRLRLPVLDDPLVEGGLDLEDGEHALGRDVALVVLLEEQGAEVPIVDDEVDLVAAVAAGIEHERLRDLIPLGQELAEHPVPRALAEVALGRRMVEQIASAELGQKRLLVVEQDLAEIYTGLLELEHMFLF
jgi:hypothetical protein